MRSDSRATTRRSAAVACDVSATRWQLRLALSRCALRGVRFACCALSCVSRLAPRPSRFAPRPSFGSAVERLVLGCSRIQDEGAAGDLDGLPGLVGGDEVGLFAVGAVFEGGAEVDE